MTRKQGKTSVIDVKALLDEDGDYLARDGAGDRAGDAGGGDDRGARRREGRADERAAGLPRGLLHAVADHAGRHAGAAGAAGPGRAVLDRLFERYQRSEKALVAALGGDVRAGGLDPQGEGDHRGAVRARLLGLGDQRDQQDAGRRARRLRRAPAGGGLSLPDPRRPLRAGARGGRHPQPGGADRDRHRLGRPAPGARGGAGQPRERDELEGLPASG